MVILDNHVSRADWCYAGTDGNEFWYSSRYPEARWIEDWKGIVSRTAEFLVSAYRSQCRTGYAKCAEVVDAKRSYALGGVVYRIS